MVLTYSGCQPHCMAACHSSCVFFFTLPSLNFRSGTSRFANHNTVGTAFALPSLPCTQTSFHFFLLFFLIICFVLVFLFFSEWKFWGRLMLPVPGEQFQAQRVGWGMGGELKRDSKKSRGKYRFLTGNEGAWKQLPCVLYFGWGSMANGARRELARPSTQHTSTIPTHTYTLTEKALHTLPTIPILQPHPLTTNWYRAEDCTFPDPAASLDLLHYLDLVYDNTTRHWGF